MHVMAPLIVRGTLKRPVPLAISLDLDELTPPRSQQESAPRPHGDAAGAGLAEPGPFAPACLTDHPAHGNTLLTR